MYEKCHKFDDLMESILQMLPAKSSSNKQEEIAQDESYPHLKSSILFSLIELVYEVQLAYNHDWCDSEKKDI